LRPVSLGYVKCTGRTGEQVIVEFEFLYRLYTVILINTHNMHNMIHVMLRHNKKNGLFRVSCHKNLGRVGRDFILFYCIILCMFRYTKCGLCTKIHSCTVVYRCCIDVGHLFYFVSYFLSGIHVVLSTKVIFQLSSSSASVFLSLHLCTL
jgi:hypothetical protein